MGKIAFQVNKTETYWAGFLVDADAENPDMRSQSVLALSNFLDTSDRAIEHVFPRCAGFKDSRQLHIRVSLTEADQGQR